MNRTISTPVSRVIVRRTGTLVCPKPPKPDTCLCNVTKLDPCLPQPKVVIVGAGLAGISAAHKLIQCNHTNFTICEATNRPGGRIHSCLLGDAVAELGAQWIQGGCAGNPVFSLGCQEGFIASPIPMKRKANHQRLVFLTTEGRAIDGFLALNGYQIFKQIEEQAFTMFTIPTGSGHGTLWNFLDKRIQQELKFIPEDKRADIGRVMYGLANAIRCRWGSDLTKMSVDSYGSYIKIPGPPVRVPIGLVSILKPLLKDIPPEKIQYIKTVLQIKWSRSTASALVKCSDGDEIKADHVIITLPLGVLKENHKRIFCPTLPPIKIEAIEKLGNGLLNKIFLEYESPFWADGEERIRFAWSCDELRIRDNWTKGINSLEQMPGKRNMLACCVGGPEASQIEELSEETIAEDVTQLLRKLTGNSTLPYPCNLIKSKWCSDPFFLGSNSFLSIESSMNHQCDLASPVFGVSNEIPFPVLLFAGEATSPGHFSTIQGARLSGIREAERILTLTATRQES